MELVFAPRLTSTVQPNDTDIHASLRKMYLQGMGSGLFKTSGTEHGTFHKTAKELHKQEEIMRRGGGVQKDESRVAEVPEEGKHKDRERNAEILEFGVVLVAESFWVKEQRKVVRFQHAGRIVATCAW